MSAFRLNIKLGHLIYLVIFVLAACLRFIHLGNFPLTDDEALSALSAAQHTFFASPFFSEHSSNFPQPAYELLTRLSYQFFGANDASARFIPALAGALLVLTPLLAQKKLGKGVTLIMAFILAFSSVFVTSSRTASGAVLSALGLMTFALAILGREDGNERSKAVIRVIGFGLALTCGPQAFTGILILAMSLILWKLVAVLSRWQVEAESIPWKTMGKFPWLVILAMVAFATCLGWSIEGLSDFFESFSIWLMGWRGTSPYVGVTLISMIPIYFPALLLVGLVGIWSALRRRDRSGILVAIVFCVALLIVFLYPARQPLDLLWIALPLSYLASGYLVPFINRVIEANHKPWIAVMVLILITFAALAYMQLSSIVADDPQNGSPVVWQSPLVFLVLAASFIFLFGLGWDWHSAGVSAIIAASCVTSFLSLSAMWRLNFNASASTAHELWRSHVASDGLPLLINTLEATSQMTTGTHAGLPVRLMGQAPHSLEWALREYRVFEGAMESETSASPIVLTEEGTAELTLPADYVGQTIDIGEMWGWNSALPPSFWKWWVERNPSTLSQRWLILVRQDIAFLQEEVG
jgi:4-amino-4-deoxy-L-arabinose transferase-like glycosyltransferase